jgi:hypothetical protein
MADITVSLDLALFDRAVLRFNQDLGLSLPAAVKRAARQLDEELVRLTPPKSQAQGRKAVKRDIGRAMQLLDPAKIRNKVLQQAVQDQEFDVVAAFLSNSRKHGSGGFANVRLEHFSRELHQRVRNRRGRVGKSQGIVVLERSEYNRYVREVQGHVGSTKYAFGMAAKKLGASVPAWILKHSTVHGDIQEDYNPTNPSVTTTNRGPGIESLGPGFVQSAVTRRTNAMNRDVDQVISGRASRYFD